MHHREIHGIWSCKSWKKLQYVLNASFEAGFPQGWMQTFIAARFSPLKWPWIYDCESFTRVKRQCGLFYCVAENRSSRLKLLKAGVVQSNGQMHLNRVRSPFYWLHDEVLFYVPALVSCVISAFIQIGRRLDIFLGLLLFNSIRPGVAKILNLCKYDWFDPSGCSLGPRSPCSLEKVARWISLDCLNTFGVCKSCLTFSTAKLHLELEEGLGAARYSKAFAAETAAILAKTWVDTQHVAASGTGLLLEGRDVE